MDVVSLITVPFSLVNLVFQFGVRVASLAALGWIQMTRATFRVPLDLCWRAMAWMVALVSLPFRALRALQRERTLEMNLKEMQTQLENLAWENKEIEEQLQAAIKDRKVIETIFEEIEEEHEKALSRIDQLENELQDLKEENARLSEVQGKSQWNYKAQADEGGFVHEGIPLSANYGVSSWGSGYKGSGLILEDIRAHGDSWAKGDKGKPPEHYSVKPAPPCPVSPGPISPGVQVDSFVEESFEQRRSVALYRSLFSSVLSLLVGMIIWEADDPCMPLVTALFIVVGMSLNSVVQFFSTIKNKPASDAVALLSINWFILGTLTTPSLPFIARMLEPKAVKVADLIASRLGIPAYPGHFVH